VAGLFQPQLEQLSEHGVLVFGPTGKIDYLTFEDASEEFASRPKSGLTPGAVRQEGAVSVHLRVIQSPSVSDR
jgi:hypothetical protein